MIKRTEIKLKLTRMRGLSRMRGLIGRPKPPAGHGLWFGRCRSVHTCFMSYDIDVVYVDFWGDVLGFETLAPWRLGRGPAGACAVVELAAGEAARLFGEEPTMEEGCGFEEACELASRHFGLEAGTSCISEAWELPGDWVFMSAWGAYGTRGRVAVRKRTGKLSDLGRERRPGMRPRGRSTPREVPWKYLPGPHTAEKAKTSRKTPGQKAVISESPSKGPFCPERAQMP